MQILNDQLSQARRDADTFTAKFVRAEAQFTEYRNQVAQRAPPAQIEATANSTAVLLGDLKAANTTLQQTLNPESGRFGFAGRESRLLLAWASARCPRQNVLDQNCESHV